jgi:hypothetical protein
MCAVSNPEFAIPDLSPRYSLFMNRAFPMLAQCVIALVVTGTVLAVAVGRAQTRPDELWKDHFAETYGLAPGELVKHVPPPFIEERLEVYRRDFPDHAVRTPQGPDAIIFEWSDDGPRMRRWRHGGAFSIGGALEAVTQLESYQLILPHDLLDKPLPGDWVVQSGATADELMAALSRLLAKELGRPCTLESRAERLEVVVLKGKWKSKDDPDRVHLSVPFGGVNLVRDLPAGSTSPVGSFPDNLTYFTGWPVIADTDAKRSQPIIEWSNEVAAKPDQPVDAKTPRAQMEPILAALKEQSGLTIEIETREITRWRLVETK